MDALREKLSAKVKAVQEEVKLLTRELYPWGGDETTSLQILGQDRWDVFKLRSMLGIMSEDLMASFTRPHNAGLSWQDALFQ